ncbi:MAG: hypothetical protein M1840_006987 [Geoglossum simile]|nr:MAG: hypothetical protein M1840_006987 [Geoglossum simile]
MQAALAQIGNETEPKEATGRIEGNKTKDTSLAKNTEMTARVEDDVMTDSLHLADDTKMDDDPPPAGNENIDDHPPPAPTKFTRAQREATTRVLQCSPNNYYSILDLERSCGEGEVKSAYRKWSRLTHPDRNGFKDSTKAFQRVADAYNVLIDPRERAKFDRLRGRYKGGASNNAAEQYNEEFFNNAFGGDSEPEDEEIESADEGTGKTISKPDAARLKIHKAATEFMERLLRDPDDKKAKEELDIYNIQIKETNEKAGFKGQDIQKFTINYTSYITSARIAQQWIDIVSANSGDSNQEKLNRQFGKNKFEGLNTGLDDLNKENHYPLTWRLKAPWPTEAKESKGKGNERGRSKGKEDSSSGGEEGQGKSGGSGKSSKKTATTTEIKVKWKPGQTRKDERAKSILLAAHSSSKRRESLTALVSGEDVGHRAMDTYLNLPEEERNDVRYKGKQYSYEDANNFKEIIGFASRPFKTKTVGLRAYYPDGYAWVGFKDGTDDLANREALRNMLGKTDADNEIAEFFEEIDETPPWKIEPEAWREPKVKRLESGSTAGKRWLEEGSTKGRRLNRRKSSEESEESDSDHLSASDRRKSRRSRNKADSSGEESEKDSDSSRLFVRDRRKGRRHTERDDSDNEERPSDHSPSNSRKQSSKARATRKPKAQINQHDMTDDLDKMVQELVKRNKKQDKQMADLTSMFQ